MSIIGDYLTAIGSQGGGTVPPLAAYPELGGALTTGGSGNAYTLISAQGFAAYADGIGLSFEANRSNTGAVTLNVNGLGAKPMGYRTAAGEIPLSSGQLVAGARYIVQFDASGNGGNGWWQLINFVPGNAAGALGEPAFFATRTAAAAATIATGVDVAETLGRASRLDGGGARYLRALSSVRGAFQDQASAWWRPDVDNIIRPETFGARGNDRSFDDSVGIQEMFDAIMENSKNGIGVASFRPGGFYYCGDGADLVVDPGFVSIHGNGAHLSFARKTCLNPASQSEILTNPSFDASTGWTGFSTINSAWKNYTIAGTGQAVYSGADADAGTYAGAYQAVTLTQGHWYRIRYKISALTFGGDQQYFSAGVRTSGPDSGGGFSKTVSYGGIGVEQVYDFKWTGATGTAWFQFKSNNPVTVDYVSLKRLPRNAGIIFDGGYSPFSIQYSPVLSTITCRELFIRGYDPPWWAYSGSEPSGWLGPEDVSAYLYGIGMLWNCDVSLFRSEVHLRDVVCQAFDTALLTANQTYLCDWTGGVAIGRSYGIRLGEGNDAGENMRFANLILASSGDVDGGAAFLNEGRYSHIYGCSIDYFAKAAIRQTGGYTHVFNTHIEKTQPDQAKNYIIDNAGTLVFHGGYWQLNGRTPLVLEHVIKNDGRLVIRDTQAFGLTSTTDELWTGIGTAHIRFSGIGQKTIAQFQRRDERTALNELSSVSSAGVLQWRCCAADDGTTRVSAYETARLKVEPLTTGLRTSGRKGLKITKLGGGGEYGGFLLVVPAPPDGMVSIEVYLRVLANAGATSGATGDLYVDCYSGDLIEQGGVYYRPDKNLWRGEMNGFRGVTWTEGRDWARVLFGNQNTNPSSVGAEFGHDWRRYVYLSINCIALPPNTVIQVCDLMTGVM